MQFAFGDAELSRLKLNFSLFCFKGDVGETSERRDGAHMGFSEHIDTILNCSELNCCLSFFGVFFF